MSDLFRKEAVAHATRRLSGEVVLASSVRSRLLALLVIGLVVIGTAFVATASYARKETVSGWLTPREGMIRLAAIQGGVLSALHVEEGEMVAAGQPIATVTLSQTLEGGDSFETLSTSLYAQGAAATARADAALARLEAEEDQLKARRSALGAELNEIRRRADLQAHRVDLARSEVSRAETIASQGFLPRREVEARRVALLSAEQEASELTSAILSYEREIGDVNARLAAIPIDIRAAQADGASARASLEQQATQTEAQSVYRVVATVPGRVAALPMDRGQTAAPGATIAVLTAGDSALEAELYVPSRAAGFVRAGQTVRLMYQAFPHQKFGTGSGRITSVSRTVLAPSEVSIPGLPVSEPVFRVHVILDRAVVSAYGEAVPLRPGMLLSADIIVDRRTLLEWLLDPLYAAGRH